MARIPFKNGSETKTFSDKTREFTSCDSRIICLNLNLSTHSPNKYTNQQEQVKPHLARVFSITRQNMNFKLSAHGKFSLKFQLAISSICQAFVQSGCRWGRPASGKTLWKGNKRTGLKGELKSLNKESHPDCKSTRHLVDQSPGDRQGT